MKDKNLRTIIPDDMLILRMMWEDGLTAQGSEVSGACFDKCVICDGFDELCVRCALCQCAHHLTCSMMLLEKFKGQVMGLADIGFKLPWVFLGDEDALCNPLCPLCSKLCHCVLAPGELNEKLVLRVFIVLHTHTGLMLKCLCSHVGGRTGGYIYIYMYVVSLVNMLL